MQTEIQLKRWVIEEAERQGIKPHTLEERLYRGRDRWPLLRRVNKRVVYVVLIEDSFIAASTG